MFDGYQPSQQHQNPQYSATSFCDTENININAGQPPVQWQPTHQNPPTASPLCKEPPYTTYLHPQQHQHSVQHHHHPQQQHHNYEHYQQQHYNHHHHQPPQQQQQQQQQHYQQHQEQQQHYQQQQEQQQHYQQHQEQQQHYQQHQEQLQHYQQHQEQQQHYQQHQEQQQHYQQHQEQQQHYQQHQEQLQQQEQEEADLQPAAPSTDVTPVKKKRGRPLKQQQQEEDGCSPEDQAAAAAKKAKRDLNRFNGMSVAEVMSRTLPDVIAHNLDILIIGINPGLMSAYKGHHYPNPGNHFWKCLFLSGFTQQQLNYSHDQDLPRDYGIGFTNMVERTTPGSKDLSSKEIREGGRHLLDKLQKYKPLIAAFNGKGIYEIFCKETFGVKAKNLEFGLQPYKIPETETVCYLMPSSSPRCAQFPRAQDKVHFYIKLKELRDQLKGAAPSREVQEMHYSFDLQLAKEDAKRMAIKEEQEDPGYEGTQGPQCAPY